MVWGNLSRPYSFDGRRPQTGRLMTVGPRWTSWSSVAALVVLAAAAAVFSTENQQPSAGSALTTLVLTMDHTRSMEECGTFSPIPTDEACLIYQGPDKLDEVSQSSEYPGAKLIVHATGYLSLSWLTPVPNGYANPRQASRSAAVLWRSRLYVAAQLGLRDATEEIHQLVFGPLDLLKSLAKTGTCCSHRLRLR